MSTRPDLLEHALAGDIFETEATQPQTSAVRESIAWNPDRFGEEQLRSLVRQVFLPGWPKPARQVVFCAVEDGDVAGICLRVGQVLAAQIPGNVALVEAHLQSDEENEDYGTLGAGVSSGRVQALARHRATRFQPPVARAARNVHG